MASDLDSAGSAGGIAVGRTFVSPLNPALNELIGFLQKVFTLHNFQCVGMEKKKKNFFFFFSFVIYLFFISSTGYVIDLGKILTHKFEVLFYEAVVSALSVINRYQNDDPTTPVNAKSFNLLTIFDHIISSIFDMYIFFTSRCHLPVRISLRDLYIHANNQLLRANKPVSISFSTVLVSETYNFVMSFCGAAKYVHRFFFFFFFN
jgi:hypothetical protein